MRALIAGDAAVERQRIRSALSLLGFTEILETQNGKEAFDAIIFSTSTPSKSIGLVVADWGGANMSGYELLKSVRADARSRNMAFIMLVDEQKKDDIRAAAAAGVDECIVKPPMPHLFRERLTHILLRRIAMVRKDVDAYFDQVDLAMEAPETEMGQRRKAEEFSRRFLALGDVAPFSVQPELEVGKTFMRFRFYGDAEKLLRKVIASDFGAVEAHQLLSQALKALGKIPQSIKELEIALQAQPESADITQKLGEAYLRDGKYPQAIEYLGKAVWLFARDLRRAMEAKGQNSLGRAKFEHGEAENDQSLQEEGIGNMNKAVELDPDMVSAYYNLMVAYQKTGLKLKAMEMFERAHQIEPKDAEGWVEMGKVYLNRDESQKALFAFKKADQLSEGTFEVYEEAALALYRSKMFRESLYFIEKAKKINPSDKFSYNLCGVIYRTMGDRHAAVMEYQRAAQLDPNDAAIIFNLGVAYFKASQEDKSLEYFRKAKTLDPSLTEVDKYLEMLGEHAGG